jgi:PBP1b-binding outer membrane lipoprotein LpoB
MLTKLSKVNMKTYSIWLVLALLVSGCATTTQSVPPQGSVQRITPQELEKLTQPPIAAVSLEELVKEAKQGKTPDEIIAKIKASNSRYDLTPAQSLALNKQGLDVKVLEYIHQANELAKQNAIADEINQRQKASKQAEDALRRERDLARQRYYYDPYWGPSFGMRYGYPWGGVPYGYHHRYYHPGFSWGLGYGW